MKENETADLITHLTELRSRLIRALIYLALGWTIANFPIVAVAVCVIAVCFWPVYALYMFCLGAIRDEYYD